MSVIICFHVTFLRMKENCIWNHIFVLTQVYVSIGSFLPQTVKQRSLRKLSKFVGIIMRKFSS